MITTLLVTLLAAPSTAVPNVTVGPQMADAATLLSAPIHEVTVFSDRARIRRSTRVRLRSGVAAFVFPDLPGSTRIDTVRVSAKRAQVLRVEASPVERERFAIEQIKHELDEIDGLSDQLAALEQKIAVERADLAFLARLKPAAPLSEEARRGRAQMKVAPAAWFQVVDFFGARRRDGLTRIHALQKTSAEITAKVNKLRREVASKNIGGFSERVIRAMVVLSGEGDDEITLEYFIEGASWKPVYDLHYDPQKGALSVQSSGTVRQATGEAWPETRLTLSTAIPGQGIDLPELLTWTLGEQTELIPRGRPARRAPNPRVFPAPTPTRRPTDEARRDEIATLKTRMLAVLGGKDANGNVEYKRSTTVDFESDVINGEIAKPSGQMLMDRKGRPAPSPPREMSGMVAPSDDTSTGESVVSAEGDSSSSRRRESYRRTSLRFGDHRAPRPQFNDPDLPAVLGAASTTFTERPRRSRFRARTKHDECRCPPPCIRSRSSTKRRPRCRRQLISRRRSPIAAKNRF